MPDPTTADDAAQQQPEVPTIESGHHAVTLQKSFEFTPLAPHPAWWTPGEKSQGRAGDELVIGDDDYRRGLKYAAFVGEPALPSTSVTIALALFEFTPVPYPRYWPAGQTKQVLRGEVIEVIADDYERGLRTGAFFDVDAPAPTYSLAGEPPLTGSATRFASWVRSCTPSDLAALFAAMDEAADGGAARLDAAREARRLLALDGVHGKHLMIHLEAAHDAIRRAMGITEAPPVSDQAQAAVEALAARLINDPEVLKAVAGGVS